MKSYYFKGHCYACKNCGSKDLKYEGVGDYPRLNELYECKSCGELLEMAIPILEEKFDGRI